MKAANIIVLFCPFCGKNVTLHSDCVPYTLYNIYMSKGRYTVLAICLILTLATMAMPVRKVRSLLRLSDGSEVYATSYGDEWQSYFVTDDGLVVEQDGDSFVLTGLTADEYRSGAERTKMYVRRKVGTLSDALVKPEGSKCIPVILVSFADMDFSVAKDSASVWAYYDAYCNGENFSANRCYGSVRTYFTDMSRGAFTPEFDIIGPVRLDSVYSYYGKDSGSVKDVHYNRFLDESLNKALSGRDWQRYDNDNNGTIDAALVIFAGPGQNYSNSFGITDVIWPKEMPTSISVNGVKVGGCSSCSELFQRANNGVATDTRPDGPGTCLHELSHAIGLPDMYDTSGSTFSMDYWSIMDYGSYVNNGLSPVAYTAYEREFMGWDSIQTLDGPCTLRLRSFVDGGKAYKIVNDANPNEYYILENRQPKGWDGKLCDTFGSGLMVTHVDYLQSAWISNRVNTNPKHTRYAIIPANNSYAGVANAQSTQQLTEDFGGHLYPGNTDNHELTDDSTPASVVFTGGFMGKPIYDIRQTDDGTVVLKYCPLGTLDSPTGLIGENITDTEATLEWDEVENAETYDLTVFDQFGDTVLYADSIASNTYLAQELTPGESYRYAVRATSDKWRDSGWTESEIFSTTEDGLSAITESMRRVNVYSTDGKLVTECFADELNRLDIRSGVYIVKPTDGKGKSVKMVVK